jgi:hypothetical protein
MQVPVVVAVGQVWPNCQPAYNFILTFKVAKNSFLIIRYDDEVPYGKKTYVEHSFGRSYKRIFIYVLYTKIP